MNKKTFLKKIRYRRDKWNTLIETIIDHGLNEEMISTNWSVKDVISHITWYDKELTNALHQKSIVDNEFWNMRINERNEMIFQTTHEQPFEDVLNTSQETFNRLIEEIEKLTDIELNADNYIQRKSDKRITYDFIAGNNFYHYEDHADILIERFDLEY